MRLASKTTLITGANNGIGLATANQFVIPSDKSLARAEQRAVQEG